MRRHLVVAIGLAAVATLIVGVWVVSASRTVVGSNSVTPRDSVVKVPAGGRLCVSRLWMPAGADAVRLRLGSAGQRPSRVALTLETAEGRRAASARVPSGGGDVNFRVRPLQRDSQVGLCLTPEGPLTGVAGTLNRQVPGLGYPWRAFERGGTPDELDGRAIPHRVSVWFLEQPHSLASALPDVARRASLFRPGFVGAWTYYAFLAFLPLLWFVGLRTLWGKRWRRAGPAVVVALVAFANGAAWALVTPAFQGPDEEAHTAYSVHLAVTGHGPERPARTRQFTTSENIAVLNAIDHFSVVQHPFSDPPWLRGQERAYERLIAERHPARDDGSGTTGAAAYGPVYYVIPALGYEVGGSFFDRLFAMRLLSAVLGALVALLAYATIRELFPGEQWPAVAGGLAVAFQPVFGFISGTVNADVGANLAGAAVIYLGVRALRRGLTPLTAVAIPVVLALGVMAKTSMLAFGPPVALLLVLLLWRRASPLRAWLAFAATVLVLGAGWKAMGGDLTPVSGASGVLFPDEDGGESTRTMGRLISYLWQVFLPPLPSMEDLYTGPGLIPAYSVYVQRPWGTFGWQSVTFPDAVFYVIALVMALTVVLVLRAGLRARDVVRTHVAEILFLAATAISVALSIHLVFARTTPGSVLLEQGRYLFPAITVGAVVAVAACQGLGRALAPVAGTAIVVGMMLFGAISQLFVLTTYYS